jgi:hypothetical protein
MLAKENDMIFRCFKNFVKSFLRVQRARMRGYEVLVDPMTGGVRWLTCQHCPFFDGAQCEVCCCMAEAKTMIAVESCPKGYWKAVWRKKVDRLED